MEPALARHEADTGRADGCAVSAEFGAVAKLGIPIHFAAQYSLMFRQCWQALIQDCISCMVIFIGIIATDIVLTLSGHRIVVYTQIRPTAPNPQ